jgi:Ca2+:H+ antiporter
VPAQEAAVSRREWLAVGAVALTTALAGVLHYAGASAVATFIVAAIALGGLAWLVALGTEVLGSHMSPAVTGVLQSTLGNLPELFVVLFALNAGENVVATASILGSLFANALLVLGLAIVAGSRASHDGVMRFSRRLPRDTATLLIMASFIIVLLGQSQSVSDRASHHMEAISAFGAVVLLAVYAFWLSDYLRTPHERSEPAHEHQGLGLKAALVLLCAAGAGAAFVSDWFVASIAPAADSLGISRAFIGLVVVGIAGNAVENVVGVLLASKGQSELSISVIKNSVAQIAAFLWPTLVLLSFAFAQPLTFLLSPVYTGALLLTALALWQITGDGEATAFEGASLVGLYGILAFLTFYE